MARKYDKQRDVDKVYDTYKDNSRPDAATNDLLASEKNLATKLMVLDRDERKIGNTNFRVWVNKSAEALRVPYSEAYIWEGEKWMTKFKSLRSRCKEEAKRHRAEVEENKTKVSEVVHLT